MTATPVTNPTPSGAVLLTKVAVVSDRCVDHVVFDFTGKTAAPPGYVVGYGSTPFSEDPSGKPVSVPGSGFIIVKVKPGYTYDFETGNRTYFGQTRIVPAVTNHVRAIVQTGDFEAVLTWVIGTNGKRPFTVEATGAPRHQLVINIS